MAYEGAGIRFTDTGDDSGQPPRQATVQDAVQLLRLRLPSFSGAPPPAAPPGMLAGGMNAPMAAMPGGQAMPPDLARQLQTVMRLLASMPNTPPGQSQQFSGGASPAAALQSILRGQTFGQDTASYSMPRPRVQYQPGPTEPNPAPFIPTLSEADIAQTGSTPPVAPMRQFASGLSGMVFPDRRSGY